MIWYEYSSILYWLRSTDCIVLKCTALSCITLYHIQYINTSHIQQLILHQTRPHYIAWNITTLHHNFHHIISRVSSLLSYYNWYYILAISFNMSGQCYSGHNGRVTGVCFSLNKKVLLSSSTDGSAMVWTSGCTDSPAVVINHTRRQPSSSSSSGPSESLSTKINPRTKVSSFSTYSAAISAISNNIKKGDSRNRPFGAEVNCARFYYMDKFIMMVNKWNLRLSSEYWPWLSLTKSSSMINSCSFLLSCDKF